MSRFIKETKNVQYHISTFIDDEIDRQNIMDSIESFKTSRDVKAFTYVLKNILDKPERLRLYDVIRRVVPLELQAEYNHLIPPVNTKSRNVKLTRPRGSTSFGFSIRGGKEHGTGVFVSEVENNSEAFFKGLLVGDQIIRVNKMTLEDSIHDEVTRLIKDRPTVFLEVKRMGMIPVKKISTVSSAPSLDLLYEEEPLNDFFSAPVSLSDDDTLSNSTNFHPLTHRNSVAPSSSRKDSAISWQMVSEIHPVSRHDAKALVATSSTASSSSDYTEVKYFIDLTGRQKFSCSICKGPREKPGIFIYATKEDGLARDAGLQPGDQIMEANGRDLMHMPFAEAVEYLKTRKTVELLIRKRVAADMFPGESSGYNSSSSSAHEEQLSPDVFQENAPKTTDSKQTDNTDEEETIMDPVEDSSDSDSDSTKSQEVTIEPQDIVAIAIVGSAAVSDGKRSRRESLEEFVENNGAKTNMLREEEEEARRKNERFAEKKRSLEYASRLEDKMISDAISGEAQFEIQKRKEMERKMAALANEDDNKTTFVITKEELQSVPSMSNAQNANASNQNKMRKKAVMSATHPTIEAITESATAGDNTTKIPQAENVIKSPEIHQPAKETLQNGSANDYKEFQIKHNHEKVLQEFHQAQNRMYALAKQKSLDNAESDISDDAITPLRTRRPSLYVPLLSPSTHAFVTADKPTQHTVVPLTIVDSKEDPKRKMTDSKQQVPKPPNYFFPNDAKVVVTISAYQGRTDINQSQRMQYLKGHNSIEIEENPLSPQVSDKPSTPVSKPPIPSPPIKVSNTTVTPIKTDVPAHNISVTKVTVNKITPQPGNAANDKPPNGPRSKSVLDRWKPNMVSNEPASTIDRVSRRQRAPAQGNNEVPLPSEPIIIMQSSQQS